MRNVVIAHNPFWPVRMEVGGRVVFPGVASLVEVLDAAHNTPPELARLGPALRVLRTWSEAAGLTDLSGRPMRDTASPLSRVAQGIPVDSARSMSGRFIKESPTKQCWAKYSLGFFGNGSSTVQRQ